MEIPAYHLEGTGGLLVTLDSKYLLTTDTNGNTSLSTPGRRSEATTGPFEANDNLFQFAPDGKSVIVGRRGVPLKLWRIWIPIVGN